MAYLIPFLPCSFPVLLSVSILGTPGFLWKATSCRILCCQEEGSVTFKINSQIVSWICQDGPLANVQPKYLDCCPFSSWFLRCHWRTKDHAVPTRAFYSHIVGTYHVASRSFCLAEQPWARPAPRGRLYQGWLLRAPQFLSSWCQKDSSSETASSLLGKGDVKTLFPQTLKCCPSQETHDCRCKITAVLPLRVSQLLDSDHCWESLSSSFQTVHPTEPYIAAGAGSFEGERLMHFTLNSIVLTCHWNSWLFFQSYCFHLSKPLHLFPTLNLIGFFLSLYL